MAGDTTPLFTCTASGYPSPSITWVYEGVFSSFHVNGLPDDVILADASREMEVRELQWQRTLLYTDSGMYKCTASNDYGDHEVTLDLLVQGECAFALVCCKFDGKCSYMNTLAQHCRKR